MSDHKVPLILLVEDNPGIAKLITFKLDQNKYRVEHRDNGKEGWEAARNLHPDLVVLDVMLPGISGFEILRKIREHPETEDLKVMMLTTKNREDDLNKGFELNVDDYMSKPFKIGEFLLRINKIINAN
ncbi:MAG TPA: response regulator [Balneolales bacterium]|nr:response regulator [Balneolales bacterium]